MGSENEWLMCVILIPSQFFPHVLVLSFSFSLFCLVAFGFIKENEHPSDSTLCA